jgi:hypothetical protein
MHECKAFRIFLGGFDLVFADIHNLRDMPKLTGAFFKLDFETLPDDRTGTVLRLNLYTTSPRRSVPEFVGKKIK